MDKDKEKLIDGVGMIYSQLKMKADALKINEKSFAELIKIKWFKESRETYEDTKSFQNLLKLVEEETRKVFHPTEEEQERDRNLLEFLSTCGEGVTVEDIQERLNSVYPFNEVIRRREVLRGKTLNGYEVWKFFSTLHIIAKELGEPIDSPKVCLAIGKYMKGIPEDLTIFCFHPIYFPPENCLYLKSEENLDPNFYEGLQKGVLSQEIKDYVNDLKFD